MVATVFAGPSANRAFAGMATEATPGTFLASTAFFQITDASPNIKAGTMSVPTIAGTRSANNLAASAESGADGSFSGPYFKVSPLLAAALGGVSPIAGDLPYQSFEICMGGTKSQNVSGALIDAFTLKLAVGAAAMYDASYKAQKAVYATASTSPTIDLGVAFGLKAVTLALFDGDAAAAIAFTFTLNNNVQTQPVFDGGTLPKFVYSADYTITGQVTCVASATTAAMDGAAGEIKATLNNGTDTQVITMPNCRFEKSGGTIRRGSLVTQAYNFTAYNVLGATPVPPLTLS